MGFFLVGFFCCGLDLWVGIVVFGVVDGGRVVVACFGREGDGNIVRGGGAWVWSFRGVAARREESGGCAALGSLPLFLSLYRGAKARTTTQLRTCFSLGTVSSSMVALTTATYRSYVGRFVCFLGRVRGATSNRVGRRREGGIGDGGAGEEAAAAVGWPPRRTLLPGAHARGAHRKQPATSASRGIPGHAREDQAAAVALLQMVAGPGVRGRGVRCWMARGRDKREDQGRGGEKNQRALGSLRHTRNGPACRRS